MIDEAEGDVKKARENIERWFNDAMERVSGWYKRRVQYIILLAAGRDYGEGQEPRTSN